MAQRQESQINDRTVTSRNRLLAALPEGEMAKLEPHLTRLALAFGEVVQEPGERITQIHFPLGGVLSAVREFQNGDIVEVATIGNEGVSGNSVALGVFKSGSRILAQIPGETMRIETPDFLKVLDSSPPLRSIILRYSQALFQHVAQVAACNRAHSVDTRCARWLLMTHDRVGKDHFTLTQEFLSQMLGVHRPTVSTAAGMLQKAGMISYVRGKITVLDRSALEEASCECYRLINAL